MAGLDGGRLNIGACSIGGAQFCLDRTIEYMKERKQFGSRLADFQALQFRIADYATEIEAARLLLHRAAVAVGEREPARDAARRARPSASLPMRVSRWSMAACSCMAAMAICAIIRSSACCATCACIKSSKAPTRSCGDHQPRYAGELARRRFRPLPDERLRVAGGVGVGGKAMSGGRPRCINAPPLRSHATRCSPTLPAAREESYRAAARDERRNLFERRGAAGIVTLNRPKALNAVTHGMVLRVARAAR